MKKIKQIPEYASSNLNQIKRIGNDLQNGENQRNQQILIKKNEEKNITRRKRSLRKKKNKPIPKIKHRHTKKDYVNE